MTRAGEGRDRAGEPGQSGEFDAVEPAATSDPSGRDAAERAQPEPANAAETASGKMAAAGSEPMPAPTGGPRSADLRLAHLHVKTGGLGLARAELESMAGRDALDTEAMLDLAEVRWRTGDLAGAGEAVTSYLSAGGDAALGFVIAAEVASAADRPAEARRLAGRALERSDRRLDAMFAGIPRSMIWPHDAPVDSTGTLFEPSPTARAGVAVGPGRSPSSAGPAAGAFPNAPLWEAEAQAVAGLTVSGAAAEQAGLWDQEHNAPGPARSEAEPQFLAGAAALRAGDLSRASLHFGVAVRLAPSMAGAVLELIGDRRSLGLDLVRGDALQLLGYEWDARQAFLAVAAGLRGEGRVTEPAMPAAMDAPASFGGTPHGLPADSSASSPAEPGSEATAGSAEEPPEAAGRPAEPLEPADGDPD